jgi:hypothetical protein
MKVHTLNQKKHKWASKHAPLLLEACTIMGKQHCFFEVRTVMTKYTTWHYSCAVNNSSNFFSNVKPICIPLPMEQLELFPTKSKTYSQHQPWNHVTVNHHSTWDCSARKTWYQTFEKIVQHQVQIYSQLKDMSLHLLPTPYFWSTLY